MSRPVLESERINSMDVLRGFALLGILLMNIQSFSMIAAAYINPTAYGDLTGANFIVWLVCHLFTDQKFMSIFSMLFGAGVVLMWQRAEHMGGNPTRIHYRRMAWMILFGILHAHIFWYGDVLFAYGMSGLLVYLVRKKSPRFLVIAAVVLAAVGSIIAQGIGLSMQYWPEESVKEFEQAWKPNEQTIQEELATYRGSWLDQARHRSPEALMLQVLLFPLMVVWKVLSLMLLGMALFKTGALSAAWSPRKYFMLIAAGAFAGVPLIAYGAYRNFAANWDIRYSFFQGGDWNYWGSYLVALGWIGVIMLWCQSPALSGLKLRVRALGRTAFSNYILQTVVCTTIFYGHGLGYFGAVDRAAQALIAVAIYATQLMIAPLWLHNFQFGPLEWLWRRLTYGKPQPFIRR